MDKADKLIKELELDQFNLLQRQNSQKVLKELVAEYNDIFINKTRNTLPYLVEASLPDYMILPGSPVLAIRHAVNRMPKNIY